MPSTHKRNTEGIKAFAIKKKEKINFNTVSIAADVSKGFLYTNNEIRKRIENLRKQQNGLPSAKHEKRLMSGASKDVLLAAKNKKIKEQAEEIKRLKKELMYLRGKIYEQ
jgi:hypothetical protein